MNNTPYITKVYLLDVPLENNYKDTLYFNDEGTQHSYFENQIVYSFTDFSYQRKDNVIRIPVHFDVVNSMCNYVMYQNTYYGNKWFYAFITDIRYINDGVTEIAIETDVIQTWMFEYNVNPSFVEREHTNNDSVGANTIPENLETGEYIENNSMKVDTCFDKTNCLPVIAVTELTGYLMSGQSYQATSDVPNGLYYIMTRTNTDVMVIADHYAYEGKSDRIVSVFIAPKELFSQVSGMWRTASLPYGDDGQGTTYYANADRNISPLYEINRATSLSGLTHKLGGNYIPRNNKLFCFPFRYLQITNNSGSCVDYRYEEFTSPLNSQQTFEISGVLMPSCSYKLIPTNYKNKLYNVDEGISLGKLPVGSWTNDIYTNWLTQNALNIKTQEEYARFKSDYGIASSMFSGIGSLVSGITSALGGDLGGIGSSISGVSSSAMSGYQSYANGFYDIQKINAMKYEHSFDPVTMGGNVNSGDSNYSGDWLSPYARQMVIKYEYAKVIDDFFDLYGYQTNRVKTPNVNHRQEWWYTKTINANITGSIPNDDITKIRNAYDNGITFWKNPSHIYNYSLSNPII